jgi:hypothetical protein
MSREERDQIEHFCTELDLTLADRLDDLEQGSIAQQLVLAFRCIVGAIPVTFEIMDLNDKEREEFKEEQGNASND